MSRNYTGTLTLTTVDGAQFDFTNFTVACWTLPQSNTGNDKHHIAKWGGGGNQFVLYIATGGSWAGAIGGNFPTGPAATNGVWQHAAQRNGPIDVNTVAGHSVWRDGVQSGSVGGVQGAQTGTAALYMGNNVNGRLCECAAWNVALSQAELNALVKGTPASMIRTGNLVGYWPMWGEGGATEYDLSGFRAHGTGAGSPGRTDHAPVGPYVLGF